MYYIFSAMAILSLFAMNVLFIMCFFYPTRIHQFNIQNESSRFESCTKNRWTLVLIVFAFIGIAILYYGGFMQLLYWLPDDFGSQNNDGNWRSYRSVVAAALTVWWLYLTFPGVFWICKKRHMELTKNTGTEEHE